MAGVEEQQEQGALLVLLIKQTRDRVFGDGVAHSSNRPASSIYLYQYVLRYKYRDKHNVTT
jgi:hypothetical protein